MRTKSERHTLRANTPRADRQRIKVFVSYRRSDDRHLAGRLRDVLATELGEENVFFDVDSVGAGRDFRLAIRESIDEIDVMIVLIGPRWDPSRLFVATDTVRMELAEALRRSKPLIPVLVENTQMPAPEEFPDDLQQVAFLNALVVRPDPDFRSDAAKVAQAIASWVSPPPLPPSPPLPPPTLPLGKTPEVSGPGDHGSHRRWALLAGIVVVAAAVAGAAVALQLGDDGQGATCGGSTLPARPEPPSELGSTQRQSLDTVQEWADLVAGAEPGADNTDLLERIRGGVYEGWPVSEAVFTSAWGPIQETHVVWVDGAGGSFVVAGLEYHNESPRSECRTKFKCWQGTATAGRITDLSDPPLEEGIADGVSDTWITSDAPDATRFKEVCAAAAGAAPQPTTAIESGQDPDESIAEPTTAAPSENVVETTEVVAEDTGLAQATEG